MSKDLKILSNRLKDLSISLEKVYCIKILSSNGLSRDLQEQSLKFNLAFSNCQGLCQGISVFSLICIINYCQGKIVLTP